MKKLILWLQELRWIVKNYQSHREQLHQALQSNEAFIKDATTLHIDFSPHGHTKQQVILIGEYQRQDYVQIFHVDCKEFSELVSHMKKYRRFTKLGRFDAPYGMKDVRAVVEREVF